MNTLELFLLDHARVHAASLTNNAGGLSVAELAARNLNDEQWRLRPHGLNSLAWIFWHIARCEDAAVNIMVANRPQVFDEEPWADRLGIVRRDVGKQLEAGRREFLPAADSDQLCSPRTQELSRSFHRILPGRPGLLRRREAP